MLDFEELEKEITEAYHKVNSKLKIEIEDLKKKKTFAAAYIADASSREEERQFNSIIKKREERERAEIEREGR